MKMAMEQSKTHGIKKVCEAMDLSRATFYRRRNAALGVTPARKSARQLSREEREKVLDTLTEERFMDQSVPEVYAQLLDDGEYLCSMRTMYRILKAQRALRERRNQRQHPIYQKPELLATDPNQVWSWDITKLKGAWKWEYYSLYTILDIYSRYVVGWLVARGEAASWAEQLIREACEKQKINRDCLTIHSDRGSPMRSMCVAELLAELGVTKTHSRPRVSNDNPYSESQFKTLKYHATFPERFGSLEDARSYLRKFFDWYNHRHRHSGIGLMTPESVHTGEAKLRWKKRQDVLRKAYERYPERFVRGVPLPPLLPKAAWINKPNSKQEEAAKMFSLTTSARRPGEQDFLIAPQGDTVKRGAHAECSVVRSWESSRSSQLGVQPRWRYMVL